MVLLDKDIAKLDKKDIATWCIRYIHPKVKVPMNKMTGVVRIWTSMMLL